MTMRLKNMIAAGLLFVAGPAWAGESLVNGEPLRYNYEYHCNGERIVVGHCYDTDDNSYCQDYYPDRPYHNGFMIQPVEKRGAVIAKLNACARVASAQASSSSGSSVHLQVSHSPGLGRASWQLLDFDAGHADFFTRARLARKGDAAVGWFTLVLPHPEDHPDIQVSRVQFMQSLLWANCANGTYTVHEIAWYDTEGKLIPGSTYVFPNPSFKRPDPDSFFVNDINVLCGRPQVVADKGPLDGDGSFLLSYYLEQLRHPASARSEAISARSGPGARPAGARTTAAGLARTTWHVIDTTDDGAIYFTEAAIKHAGKSGQGWITTVYDEPQNFGPDAPSVRFVQNLVEADCTGHRIKLLATALYDTKQKLVIQSPVPDQAFQRADPGTVAADKLSVLCGTRKVAGDQPIVGDGEHLWEITRIMLALQKQDAAGQKP